jgi:solute carrier family 25 carnitine/acylcarnitine transporter 20/29
MATRLAMTWSQVGSAAPVSILSLHQPPLCSNSYVSATVGILATNPLEVLKVRLQTSVPSPRVGAGSRSSASNAPNPSAAALSHQVVLAEAVTPARPGLAQLWRKEGVRFLFAGAAGPILGLAFIDSFFFASYGRCM